MPPKNLRRGIAFIPQNPVDEEQETSVLYDNSLYDESFKENPSNIELNRGILKNHGIYTVESFIETENDNPENDKLIKKTVYKFEYDTNLETVFNIAKTDVRNEVNYQERARIIADKERARIIADADDNGELSFHVPKIFKFNYYQGENRIITLIEMQNIKPGEKIVTNEIIKAADDFLKKNNIYHNDLFVDKFLVGDFKGDRYHYNRGNIIIDAEGNNWIIDFGSASDKTNKPRGGKKTKRKRRRNKRTKKHKRF